MVSPAVIRSGLFLTGIDRDFGAGGLDRDLKDYRIAGIGLPSQSHLVPRSLPRPGFWGWGFGPGFKGLEDCRDWSHGLPSQSHLVPRSRPRPGFWGWGFGPGFKGL